MIFSDWPKLEAGQKLEKLSVAKQVLAIWGILLQQFGEGNGTPVLLLENPMDRGAW